MEETKTKLLEIEIPNYITEVKISNSRRATYYRFGNKLPKKYLDTKLFVFKYFGNNKVLYDNTTNKPIIKNTRSFGKPRIKKINGNELVSGYAVPFLRAELFRQVKEYFLPFFKNGSIITDYPIMIKFVFYNVLKKTKNINFSRSQDIDNLALIYKKNILDILQETNIIQNDNPNFIREIREEFIPCKLKDKKLIVQIYKYNGE